MGRPVESRVVCISQGLHKEILTALTGGVIMAWAYYDCLIIALHQSVSLCVVASRCRVFCTKIGTQGAAAFAEKLCTVVGKKI